MNKNVNRMILTAMFTAIIFVLTRFISIPVATGYIHFGDALVYLTASLLGGPWAVFASAVGEALADLTSGWVSYIPATLIIKSLVAIPFILCYKKSERIITVTTAILSILSGIITVCGYFAADMIIDDAYAFVNITGNVIQAVSSSVLFIVIGLALDGAKVKKKLFINRM